MIKRLENWPILLDAYIESRRRMPFAWGTHDCCQFARGGVLAIAGRDLGVGLGLRRYTTARGAAATLKRLGGIEAIPTRSGLREVDVKLARRGDVALCESDGERMLGLSIGAYIAVPAKTGLTFYPALSAVRMWRVG